MTARTLALRGAAVAVSVALLAWLLADARWQGVGARLARIDGGSLAGVALLFAASYAMRGARIHGEFRDEIGRVDDPGGRHGVRLYLCVLRLTLVHNALVNVLPFRSGEAAFPVLLKRWFDVGTARAVVALLWLRAQDAIVVAALAAAIWPGVPTAWRLVAIAAIAIGAWAVPALLRRPAVAVHASPRLAKLHALLERSTRRNAAGWSWTIGNWTAKLVAESWLLAMALGLDRTGSIADAALGAIGAELAAILPIQGVAGFGTFEAGAAALMTTQGLPLQTGLEAALVLHAVVLALAVIGGAVGALALPGPMPVR